MAREQGSDVDMTVPALPRGAGWKVVVVTDIVTPYFLAVFEALAEQVTLTVLFCSRTGSRAMPWTFDRPFPFRHRVVGGVTLSRRSPDGTDYHVSPRIAAAIARERPDAVVSAGFSAPTVYAALVAGLLRRPLIIQSDGTSASERDQHPLQQAARRALMPVAAACVANSTMAAERFADLGMREERIFLAPHTTRMEPLWEVARGRVERVEGPLRVLTVGRLIPRKAVDRLLRAVHGARALGADVRLTVAGDGPEEATLRRLADDLELHDVVDWHGFLEQFELPALYAAADVFAFPTLRDTFGIVLIEAAAAGLAVLASPRGGATADLVRDGQTGLVIDPDDAEGWVEALLRLSRSPRLVDSMGRAGHELTLGRTPARAAAGYVAAVAAARGCAEAPVA